MSINGLPVDDVERMLEVLRGLLKKIDGPSLKEATVAVQRRYEKRIELHFSIEGA